MTILSLGFWKKLVYILEKKISLSLCLKFIDFRNYNLLMKAFMTQEEKIKNKALLDVWTIQLQVKNIIIEKQRIMTQVSKRTPYSTLIAKLIETTADIVSADQLHQKNLKGFVSLHEKIGEYFEVNFVYEDKDKRAEVFNKLGPEIKELVSTQLKAF